MRKIHLTLILIAALWSALPADSPLRHLFDRVEEDLSSGDLLPAGDPETDPVMINTPPPK